MSAKMTVVSIPGTPGYGVRGHVPRAIALAEASRYYERLREEAAIALAFLAEDLAVVYHQRGIHVVRDRREVPPDGQQ